MYFISQAIKRKIGSPKPRTITLGWSHRSSIKDTFEKMPGREGGKKYLTLEADKIYSVQDITRLAVKAFWTKLKANYFDESLSTIQIGKNDGTIIEDFTNAEGKKGLWNYGKNISVNGHKTHLHLLTTYNGTNASTTTAQVASPLKSMNSNQTVMDRDSAIQGTSKSPLKSMDNKEFEANGRSSSKNDYAVSKQDVYLMANVMFGCKPSSQKRVAIADWVKQFRDTNYLEESIDFKRGKNQNKPGKSLAPCRTAIRNSAQKVIKEAHKVINENSATATSTERSNIDLQKKCNRKLSSKLNLDLSKLPIDGAPIEISSGDEEKDKRATENTNSFDEFPDCASLISVKDNMKTTIQMSSIDELPDCRSLIFKENTKTTIKTSSFKKLPDCSSSISKASPKTTKKTSSIKELPDSASSIPNTESPKNQVSACNFDAFNRPKDIKRRKIDLQDINSLELPTITEIPLEDLKFTGEILDSGSYAVVSKARWSGTSVAVKTMKTLSVSPKNIVKEVAILKQVSHDNIRVVAIMGIAAAEIEFHIVMQLVTGNTLRDIIFKPAVNAKFNLSLEDKHDFSKQICTAITWLHMHPKKFVLRDIKPANILVNEKKS